MRQPSTDLPHGRLGSLPKLRSCLRRLRPPRVEGRKVTFSFAIQFWFPGPLQLSLPAPSISVGLATCASPSKIEAESSLSTDLSCVQALRVQQPTCSAAPFRTSFANALASGSGPLLVKETGLEGCIPNPDLGSLVGSRCTVDVGDGMLEYGRRAKPPVQRFNLGSAPYVSQSQAEPRPVGRGDLANANAIHSFPSAGLLAAIEGGASAYTCFESIRGTDVRRKFHYWDDAQCAADAIGSSSLPNPAPRILIHCLPGFPTPQIIVTQTAMLRTHRAVAILYEEAPLEPWICDIPLRASIRNILHAQAFATTAPRHAWVRLFRAGTAFSCVVNARPISCDVIVPADADVVRLTAPVALQPMPANPQADARVCQPVPPIPLSSAAGGSSSSSDVQGSGMVRAQDAPASDLAYPAHPPPVLSSTRPGLWTVGGRPSPHLLAFWINTLTCSTTVLSCKSRCLMFTAMPGSCRCPPLAVREPLSMLPFRLRLSWGSPLSIGFFGSLWSTGLSLSLSFTRGFLLIRRLFPFLWTIPFRCARYPWTKLRLRLLRWFGWLKLVIYPSQCIRLLPEVTRSSGLITGIALLLLKMPFGSQIVPGVHQWHRNSTLASDSCSFPARISCQGYF